MAKHSGSGDSARTQEQATALAKANQRPGQTKAQTKLIEEGIRRGISQYKKQQKALARERDKQRKKQTKSEDIVGQIQEQSEQPVSSRWTMYLPWGLFVLSWIGFIVYLNR
ncbi:MAG: hypothetical protein CENE_02392 [Candidatus Celerinatantimonas neptuna]|nr:MAG: hypothetical protein CENE_02392 [Candidatus Celerinatantimonas neptuna]